MYTNKNILIFGPRASGKTTIINALISKMDYDNITIINRQDNDIIIDGKNLNIVSIDDDTIDNIQNSIIVVVNTDLRNFTDIAKINKILSDAKNNNNSVIIESQMFTSHFISMNKIRVDAGLTNVIDYIFIAKDDNFCDIKRISGSFDPYFGKNEIASVIKRLNSYEFCRITLEEDPCWSIIKADNISDLFFNL